MKQEQKQTFFLAFIPVSLGNACCFKREPNEVWIKEQNMAHPKQKLTLMSKTCFQRRWKSNKEEAYSYSILNWTIMYLLENMLYFCLGCEINNFHFAGTYQELFLFLSWSWIDCFNALVKVSSQIVLGPYRWVVFSRRNASWGGLVPRYLLPQTTRQKHAIQLRC